MTYSELLRDPRWQKKRLEILQRDGWECTSCGDASQELQVHHRRYEYGKNPWDYDDADLSTVCKGCHSRLTRLKKSLKKRMDNLSEGGLGILLEFVGLLAPVDTGDIPIAWEHRPKRLEHRLSKIEIDLTGLMALAAARRAGLKLSPDGERERIEVVGEMTDAMRERLAEVKQETMRLLALTRDSDLLT